MGTYVIKQTFRRAVMAVSLCAVLAVSQTATVQAAAAKSTAPAPVTNTNSLKVSPVRSEISIEAGKTGIVKTYITNITGAPIVVSPIENDFVAGDEKGTPSLILDDNSYAPTHSLKRFMVPLKNVTVQPGESKEVLVTITVPATAQAGGYFGAIRFAPASGNSGGQVNLSPSVASLILMTVPGPTTEQLNLTNFDIQQNGGTGEKFSTPDNLEVLLRFENKGNVQESPFGQVYVKKGGKVVYTYPFNQDNPKSAVLPDSARRWTVKLQNIGKFGKYTVGATFTHGSKSEAIEIEKTIWIVPTSYIIGAVGAVLGLLVLITIIIVALRSYKRKIMRSSSRYRSR